MFYALCAAIDRIHWDDVFGVVVFYVQQGRYLAIEGSFIRFVNKWVDFFR